VRKSPALDLKLLEERLREELFRQLGRDPHRDEDAGGSAPQLDTQMLEERIREELARQLGKRDPTTKEVIDPLTELPWDKAMLEEAVREALFHFLQKDKSKSIEGSESQIDLSLLEARVREVLYRKLGKGRVKDRGERTKLEVPDRTVLEARVREEIRRQFKGYRKSGKMSVRKDWRSKVDLELVENQIRNVLKKCLQDMFFKVDWNLSDEDLEGIIQRTLME